MQLIKPQILLGDDHGMIRKGMSLFIQTEIGNYSIREADSCSKVMSELNAHFFTHLILDIIFADGNALEILPNIKKLYPSLRILIFSMQPSEIHAEAFRQLNINYFLSKTADNEAVLRVMTNFLHNNRNMDPDSKMLSSVNPFKSLSIREIQILHYMLNGFGTKQISETLNLQMNTVSTLKKRIYIKTESANFKALIDICTLYKINH